MHLEGADGGDQHDRGRADARLAALDVDELLGAEVGAEAGLRHDVIAEAHRRAGGDDAVAAVRDVGERAAVDEGRVVLEGLDQVGLDRVLEQRGHRARHLEVADGHRLVLAVVGDDDPAQAGLEVHQVGRQAERGHALPLALKDGCEPIRNTPKKQKPRDDEIAGFCMRWTRIFRI